MDVGVDMVLSQRKSVVGPFLHIFPLLAHTHTLTCTHIHTRFPCQAKWNFLLKVLSTPTDVEAISLSLSLSLYFSLSNTDTHTHTQKNICSKINTKTHSLLECTLPCNPGALWVAVVKEVPVRGSPKIAWVKMQERGVCPLSHRKIQSSVCVC